jgi:hypothetical protein
LLFLPFKYLLKDPNKDAYIFISFLFLQSF